MRFFWRFLIHWTKYYCVCLYNSTCRCCSKLHPQNMSCLNPSNFIKLPKSQVVNFRRLQPAPPQHHPSPSPDPPSHSMVGPMSSAVSCNDTKTVSSGAQAVFHPPVSTCTFCRGAPGSLIKHASSTKGASSSTVPGGFHIKLENHGKSLCHSDIMIPEHENGTFNMIYIYIYIFEHTTTRHKGFLHVSAPWLACENQCAMQFWLPIFLKKQCSPISSALCGGFWRDLCIVTSTPNYPV